MIRGRHPASYSHIPVVRFLPDSVKEEKITQCGHKAMRSRDV